MAGDNDKLSKFLANYPTQIDCLQCFSSSNIRVFSSSSSSDDDIVHEKIKSAFCNVNLNDGLIQFWSPLQHGHGRRRRKLLSTSNQPFSLEHLDSCFLRYRILCLDLVYTIDKPSVNNTQFEHEEEMEIRSGGPVTAFFNHMPSVLNLVLNKGSSLECGFTSLYLPVFYHTSTSCVGVVECSMKMCDRIDAIYQNLITSLQMVGLHTFHLQDTQPYKTISGLKFVSDELDSALQMVHESHGFTLSQVWISYQNDNHLPFKDKHKKQKFGVKLVGHCADEDPSFIKDYHDTCHLFPLIMGDGITGRTLQTHEPHFCRDIDELQNNGLLALIPYPVNTYCSCLSLCLRSSHTGDVDYVFEFLWPLTRDIHILSSSLLLTLNSCLPSFKLASGARILGDDYDELRVVDVENSTGIGTGFFKIPRSNIFPKALEQGSTPQDCISSSEVKCNKTTTIPLPRKNVFGQNKLYLRKCNVVTFAQRELSGLSECQVGSTQEYKRAKREHSASSSDSETSPYNDEFVISAEFKEKIRLFHIPSSSKLADMLKKIERKFKCVTNTYRLHYFYRTLWIDLFDEDDWVQCIKILRNNKLTDLQIRVQSTA